jgi:uncharacterized protein YbaP (TraB family)
MKISFLRNLFFALLGFVALQSATAQDSSLLWKVTGNGLEKESYLFGTIHVICKADFKMDDRILTAFDQSESVVMEMDLSDPELIGKIQKVSMNPGMKNIKEDLDADDAAVIDAFFIEHYGVGLTQLGIFKPFMLSSMALMKALPCDDQGSYETFFLAKATESKKTIIGLETPEFQIGIFDQIPQNVQLEELVKMLKEKTGTTDFEKMTEIYLDEDVDGLFEMMNEEGMMSDYQELILDDRNKAWISILEEEMKSQKLFIAVGAGHLGGENGVISLLRNAGYRVEPIKK